MKTKKHAIQLVDFKTVEITFKARNSSAFSDEVDSTEFSLMTGHSPFNKDSSSINVMAKAVIGELDDFPLYICVDVRGTFVVDTELFDVQYIESWAKRNAPYILYPYLREHVHSISCRVGLKGMMLPLLEVPTFKISPVSVS
ncbi:MULTISPECIES: hypothetical protein [Providencia]|uniref:hypothetical protein n=1 Tax=Providencia TaxID=586 RepID=UPI0034DD907C